MLLRAMREKPNVTKKNFSLEKYRNNLIIGNLFNMHQWMARESPMPFNIQTVAIS